MLYVIASLFALGLVATLLGWWGTVREIFSEDRSLGYMAMAPFLLPGLLRAGYTALLLPLVSLPYSFIHRDDLRREFWLQLSGVALMGAGLGLRHLRGP